MILFLCAVIAILLITGGLYHESSHAKLELAQIDAFAWALLLLAAVRKLKKGAWLPPALERTIFRAVMAIERKPLTVLFIAIGTYALFYSWLSVFRFDSFRANAFDLGYVDQALWSTTRVGFLHSDLSRGGTYLGEHFSPILGVVALLYRIWDSVYALFVFQSTALGISAAIVYALARKMGANRAASALAGICLLLYQPLRLANEFDFREDNLFVPILLGALLAIETRKWLWFWVLVACAWTIKENAPIFTGLIGVWLLWRAREIKPTDALSKKSLRIHGAVLAATSATVFLLVNGVVTPHFSGGTQSTMLSRRLSHLGPDNATILRTIFLKPWIVISELAKVFFQKSVLRYALTVFVPFMAMASGAPVAMAIAVIGFTLNVLMNVTSVGFHYECALIPFLMYALAAGVARSSIKESRVKPATAFLLILGFLVFYGRGPAFGLRRSVPTDRDRMVARELEKIPALASIETQSALFPHLSHRPSIRMISSTASADYVVLDLSSRISRYGNPDLDARARSVDPIAYEKLVDRDGLLIWRRRLDQN